MDDKKEYREETIYLKKGQDISDLELTSGTYLVKNELNSEEERIVQVDNFLN